jgi:4-phospho-D-threonate 3-dehydrogenase / 4-phospho-D-erythronate 3-dehydrogenase
VTKPGGTGTSRPIVALTVGDVTGVGPELVARCLSELGPTAICRPLVIGPFALVVQRSEAVGSPLTFKEISDVSVARFEPGLVEVLDTTMAAAAESVPAESVPAGEVDINAARLAGECLETAFQLAEMGAVQGVVGAPMNKAAFRLAGYDYLDEIEYLTDLTKSPNPRLFGILGRLWTTCATLHLPFRDVAASVTRATVLEAITAMHEALMRNAAGAPGIAVAALNPHNGEGGLLGREELDEIAPAIEDARSRGVDASGPFPADTIFPRAMASKMDGVVCMYHDQANIARKLHGFQNSASAVLGLPAPYATTAHGTAYDLVGTGKADPSSLIAALDFVTRQASAVAAEDTEL